MQMIQEGLYSRFVDANKANEKMSHGSGNTSLPSVSSAAAHAESRERYIEKFDFPYCAPIDKYEKIAKIGQGTFGEVFKARDKHEKTKIVALKKVLMENEKEGFPITALREIRILQLLNHTNIVNLIEICRQYSRHKTTFYLVFDFAEHDLAGLLSNINVKFSLGEIKKVMQQMIEGLFYIHNNKIIHRDMKAANILITKQGILKLADFGLSRAISISTKGKGNRYTNRVVTLWYRPPELLLGERNYGTAVDMWGCGCIMAEMWTRSPIMQGNTEQHQLTLIAQLCGTFSSEVWPGVESMDLFSKMEIPKGTKRRVKERLKPYVKVIKEIRMQSSGEVVKIEDPINCKTKSVVYVCQIKIPINMEGRLVGQWGKEQHANDIENQRWEKAVPNHFKETKSLKENLVMTPIKVIRSRNPWVPLHYEREFISKHDLIDSGVNRVL